MLSPFLEQICAYDPTPSSNGLDTAPCGGDSGGPLLTKGTAWSDDVVNGLTSWGFDPCGIDGTPSIFSKIGAQKVWITAMIKTWKVSATSVKWV